MRMALKASQFQHTTRASVSEISVENPTAIDHGMRSWTATIDRAREPAGEPYHHAHSANTAVVTVRNAALAAGLRCKATGSPQPIIESSCVLILA